MKDKFCQKIAGQDKFDGIVLANDAMQFSAGVNLNYFYNKAINKEFKEIDSFLNNFQQYLYLPHFDKLEKLVAHNLCNKSYNINK